MCTNVPDVSNTSLHVRDEDNYIETRRNARNVVVGAVGRRSKANALTVPLGKTSYFMYL